MKGITLLFFIYFILSVIWLVKSFLCYYASLLIQQIAEITFNLWYRLSEEVYQRDYQPLTDMFKPHIERLIKALARHCQWEPDISQLPEEGDEFYVSIVKALTFI